MNENPRQLFGTAAYSPFHRDMLGPLFDVPGHCGLLAQGGAGESHSDRSIVLGERN